MTCGIGRCVLAARIALQDASSYPHLTLMVSEGWAPVLSNTVINATCGVGKPFHDAYEAARKNILPAKNAGVLT